jgi:hypothetical protein
MLEMKEIEPGKPGTIWGKTPRKGEETVQFWGTNVIFALKPAGEQQDPEQRATTFSITLGRMLKTPGGEWRLAAAPTLAGSFHTFLAAGFHLKPEILQPEHYPFPLSVGNFWLFHVRKPNADSTDTPPVATPVVEEVRIEVTHIEQGRGYRVVTLKRHDKTEDTKVSTFHYLVTPKRLYTCNNYCKSRSKDLSFVLDYVSQRVPVLVLPMLPDMAWGLGGEIVEHGKGKYRTAQRLELTVVPAGEFSETVVVLGESGGMRETRHFKPGLGFVRREVETSAGPRVDELVKFRILTAE